MAIGVRGVNVVVIEVAHRDTAAVIETETEVAAETEVEIVIVISIATEDATGVAVAVGIEIVIAVAVGVEVVMRVGEDVNKSLQLEDEARHEHTISQAGGAILKNFNDNFNFGRTYKYMEK